MSSISSKHQKTSVILPFIHFKVHLYNSSVFIQLKHYPNNGNMVIWEMKITIIKSLFNTVYQIAYINEVLIVANKKIA